MRITKKSVDWSWWDFEGR